MDICHYGREHRRSIAVGLTKAPAKRRPPSAAESEVLAALRGVDPERVTPLDALEMLARLVARLRAEP